MTTFNEREKGFEKKFAFDADLKFRAESRRNKAVAEWAGAKLGLTGEALEAYIKDVRRADLAEKGDDDVIRKVRADLTAKGIKVDDHEIRTVMGEALAKAVLEIEAAKE
ncbi:MAG TPA: DUF1476 domain-containing protein [Hyphomicrobium sp.]|jgi:hypothetical protein|uniref:DUF1476 domain-containing protein n=1 Tax=Hyphomicrobium sp. TaxID=82 RepID=UPI002B5935C1|nr:DUF1476 domain-containing protein [Hyphomicrobium sp.]HXE02174.1 DUF1476 domain-containing protein [Hyphomicrobium sp.]